MERPGDARTRRPKEETRAVILERAYEMYLRRDLIHGDERLSQVLDSLGYTTGAGYQIWPNQAAFRLDLQVYLAERIDYASVGAIREDIAAIHARKLPLDEQTLAVGDLYIEYFQQREEFYLSLRFYAMGDDRPSEITEAIRDGYTRLGWELTETLGRIMSDRGLVLREGHTMGQFAATLAALAEGFALRHRTGPEIEPVEIDGRQHHPFAVAMLAVVHQYTIAAD
jgi:hypothetical protein